MIHVQAKPGLTVKVPASLLKNAALKTLEHQGVPKPYTLTILLADDTRLQSLNRDYLGINSPTDVLSFPSSEIDPETGERYLGDVIISMPRAAEQAKVAGHPVNAEARLLVVHGVLHLLGHDHAGAEDKARMWKAQQEILSSLALGYIQIREE